MAEEIPPGQEHASKPGPITYVILATLLVIYLIAIYGSSLKRFFGIE